MKKENIKMSNQMFLCQTSFSDIFFGLSSTEFHPPWIQTEGKDIFQSHPFPQSFTEVWKNKSVFPNWFKLTISPTNRQRRRIAMLPKLGTGWREKC